jgi:hypothetical protein
LVPPPLGEAVPDNGLQLVPRTLGMDPTQAVLPDVQRPGAVADDDCPVQEAMVGDGAPRRALEGEAHWVAGHPWIGDAELPKVALPGGLVGKPPQCMPGRPPDDRPRQRMLAPSGASQRPRRQRTTRAVITRSCTWQGS